MIQSDTFWKQKEYRIKSLYITKAITKPAK